MQAYGSYGADQLYYMQVAVGLFKNKGQVKTSKYLLLTWMEDLDSIIISTQKIALKNKLTLKFNSNFEQIKQRFEKLN